MRRLIILLLFVSFISSTAGAQTNLLKIPITGSGGTWSVLLIGDSHADNKVSSADTLTGTFDSPYWEFAAKKTGFYNLWYSSSGAAPYTKATNFSGPNGRFILGSLDLLHPITLRETADPDSNGQIDTQGIEDAAVELAKLAANSVNSSKVVDSSLVLADLVTGIIDNVTLARQGTSLGVDTTGTWLLPRLKKENAPVLNLKELGLVGDNSTDNAPLLTSILSTYSGDSLVFYLPAGDYKFSTSTTYTFDRVVVLQGEGREAARFIGNGSAHTFFVFQKGFVVRDISFENMRYAIRGGTGNIRHFAVEGCLFRDIKKEAILYDNASYTAANSLKDVHIIDNIFDRCLSGPYIRNNVQRIICTNNIFKNSYVDWQADSSSNFIGRYGFYLGSSYGAPVAHTADDSSAYIVFAHNIVDSMATVGMNSRTERRTYGALIQGNFVNIIGNTIGNVFQDDINKPARKDAYGIYTIVNYGNIIGNTFYNCGSGLNEVAQNGSMLRLKGGTGYKHANVQGNTFYENRVADRDVQFMWADHEATIKNNVFVCTSDTSNTNDFRLSKISPSDDEAILFESNVVVSTRWSEFHPRKYFSVRNNFFYRSGNGDNATIWFRFGSGGDGSKVEIANNYIYSKKKTAISMNYGEDVTVKNNWIWADSTHVIFDHTTRVRKFTFAHNRVFVTDWGASSAASTKICVNAGGSNAREMNIMHNEFEIEGSVNTSSDQILGLNSTDDNAILRFKHNTFSIDSTSTTQFEACIYLFSNTNFIVSDNELYAPADNVTSFVEIILNKKTGIIDRNYLWSGNAFLLKTSTMTFASLIMRDNFLNYTKGLTSGAFSVTNTYTRLNNIGSSEVGLRRTVTQGDSLLLIYFNGTALDTVKARP